MIRATFPHMVLNSHNVPGVKYKMWNTGTVPKDKSVDEIVDWVRIIAKSAPGGNGLQTLIFNSHGKPGIIKIGKMINLDDVTKFRPLKGLVQNIWIVACRVALIAGAGTTGYGDTPDSGDGNYFCYRLAQESGASITASTATQKGETDYPLIDDVPYGYIDRWEGTVYKWNSKGEVISVITYD